MPARLLKAYGEEALYNLDPQTLVARVAELADSREDQRLTPQSLLEVFGSLEGHG